MRVTQSMLSDNNLKYISNSYSQISKLQDQLTSGKVITRPSDDPVIAMKGIRYRTQVAEVEQYQRNLNQGMSWLENADTSLDETGSVLQRIRELTLQAANDTYDSVARNNIAEEIGTLQEHIYSLAETKIGDKYIFNGTDTENSPINRTEINMNYSTFATDLGNGSINGADYVVSYQGETFSYDSGAGVFKSTSGDTISIDSPTQATRNYKEKLEYRDGEEVTYSEKLNPTDLIVSKISAVSQNDENILMEVSKGVQIPINIKGSNAYSIQLFSGLESIKKMITNPDSTGAQITKAVNLVEGYINDTTATRSALGAKVNRAEMVDSRLQSQLVVATNTLSQNEDADFEKVMIGYTNQKLVHDAALQVGARIMQQTLLDYLK